MMRLVRGMMLTAALATFALPACKSDDKKATPETEAPTENPTPVKPEPVTPDPPATEAAIPTQEDFEELALIEITADNLEAELEKLEEELE